MSILKIKQSSECSENTGSSNARMELTNQEGPECDSSETDGALYCDKCKQRPAHTPTVFSQGQTTPAAMLVSSLLHRATGLTDLNRAGGFGSHSI